MKGPCLAKELVRKSQTSVIIAIITLVWLFLTNSFAKQGPFKTDTLNLGLFFKRVWEIVVIFLFLLSYLRPFVRIKIGDFTL